MPPRGPTESTICTCATSPTGATSRRGSKPLSGFSGDMGGEDAVVAEGQGVPVRLQAHHPLHADQAVAAARVLHHHRAPEHRAHGLGQEARQRVQRAAGRRGDDGRERAAREVPGVLLGARARRRGRRGARGQDQGAPAGLERHCASPHPTRAPGAACRRGECATTLGPLRGRANPRPRVTSPHREAMGRRRGWSTIGAGSSRMEQPRGPAERLEQVARGLPRDWGCEAERSTFRPAFPLR